MNPPSLGSRPAFVNSTLYRIQSLQNIKNNLMLTLANYIAETTDKNNTLSALTDIQNSTCSPLTKTVNGKIIAGVTIPNNQCDC
jgi:hypothetical protein